MLLPERWDRILTWTIAMSGCRLLQINPWASQEVLKKRFEQLLLKLGRAYKPPFKRRGRRAANLEVTPLDLDRWVNHSILAVFDLDFYSEVFAKRRLSRSDLCKKVDPKTSDAVEWAKTARQLLQEVVDGLEFLIAQAQPGAE
jgi:hypothetical protein